MVIQLRFVCACMPEQRERDSRAEHPYNNDAAVCRIYARTHRQTHRAIDTNRDLIWHLMMVLLGVWGGRGGLGFLCGGFHDFAYCCNSCVGGVLNRYSRDLEIYSNRTSLTTHELHDETTNN